MSAINGFGEGTLAKVSRLNRAGHLMHGGLETVVRRVLVEDIDAHIPLALLPTTGEPAG
jgi:hypothetical protein